MAKSTSSARLMRDLARAAKSQRKLVAKLFDIYGLQSPAPARRSVARKPAAPRVASTTNKPVVQRPALSRLSPAPGRWFEAHFPLPSTPGRALAQSMSYWLYLPQHLPDTAAPLGVPLVVMLHGCHQTAHEFAHGTRMNALAEAKGFAVLYPQQLVSAHAQRCWRWFDRSAQEGYGEAGALAALIAHVSAQHHVDYRRIYACGLSAGAGMAAVLALTHPELIAAVGLHSGPVFGAGHSPMGALHVMRYGAQAQADAAISALLERRAAQPTLAAIGPMPALLIHGEDDPVVSQVNQQQLARQWLQLNGLPVGPATRVTVKAAGRGGSRNAHEIQDFTVRRKLILRIVRIAGLRHEWSGGDPALRFNAKARPDASRMMLEFFGKHRR